MWVSTSVAPRPVRRSPAVALSMKTNPSLSPEISPRITSPATMPCASSSAMPTPTRPSPMAAEMMSPRWRRVSAPDSAQESPNSSAA